MFNKGKMIKSFKDGNIENVLKRKDRFFIKGMIKVN